MNEELKNKLLYLKNGSGIHIKKENRGKFTSYCGGKVTSACIARGKASPNPAIRKRATFAANARKWKHGDGGVISMQRGYNMPQVIDYSAFNPSKNGVFKYVDNKLKDAGYDYFQRLAILSSIDRESKGNPLAENGPWQGLLQWNGDRYRFNSQDSTAELLNQTRHLLLELNKSGWNGNKELQKRFLNAENIQDANDAFVDGFVRPGNRDREKQIRYNTAIKGLTNNRGRYTTYDSSLPGIPGRFQKGGLVYQPRIIEEEPVFSIDEIGTFPVQPVRIPEVKVKEQSKEQVEEPVTEQVQEQSAVQQPVTRQTVTQSVQTPEIKPQVDNTRVQQPAEEGKGKVYKSSEKQKFQDDMYNAYIKALKKRGLSDKDAKEFAKKLTTQDILESNWGQSSLSRNFNFGGVKDFSGKGVAKDTTEFIGGKKVSVKQPFRKFASVDDYVNYKINLVGNKWKVFGSSPDQYYSLIVSGPQKYATDPNYTSKLTNLHKQIWT